MVARLWKGARTRTHQVQSPTRNTNWWYAGALMKSRASLVTRCLIPTESVTVTDHIYLSIIILYKSLQCQL